MENPFELICQKLDAIIALQTRMVKLLEKQEEPVYPDARPRMRLNDFCKEYKISRPTAHAWALKKIIVTEKIGRCVYVLTDSILIEGSMVDFQQRISSFKKKF